MSEEREPPRPVGALETIKWSAVMVLASLAVAAVSIPVLLWLDS